jgi:hypothetical protein
MAVTTRITSSSGTASRSEPAPCAYGSAPEQVQRLPCPYLLADRSHTSRNDRMLSTRQGAEFLGTKALAQLPFLIGRAGQGFTRAIARRPWVRYELARSSRGDRVTRSHVAEIGMSATRGRRS